MDIQTLPSVYTVKYQKDKLFEKTAVFIFLAISNRNSQLATEVKISQLKAQDTQML